MTSVMRGRGTLAVLTMLAWSSAVQATNGYFASGYSLSQRAMGGAGTAMAEDSLVAAINPANLVWVGDRLDIGLTGFAPYRGYTASGPPAGAQGIFTVDSGSQRSQRLRFWIPSIGYVHRIDDVSSWGVAMYGNGGMNTTYDGGSATFGQGNPLLQAQCNGTFGGGARLSATDALGLCGNKEADTSIDLRQLLIVPSYSRKMWPRGSIGISPVLAVQQFRATGLGAFARFSNDPGHVTDNGYSTSYGGGLRVGFLQAPSERVSIGASYQSRFYMSKLEGYAGLFAQQGGFDIPQTWNAGLAIAVTRNQKIALDFQRIDYHQVRSVGNSLDGSAFVNNCAMPRLFGNNAASPACLGADSGPGFGWQNMSVYKIGYQLRFSDLTLRLGYSFARQPIPSDQVLFNILAPATIQKHYTMGLSYRLTDSWSFDSAAVYAAYHEVTGTNPLSGSLLTIHLREYECSVGATYHFGRSAH